MIKQFFIGIPGLEETITITMPEVGADLYDHIMIGLQELEKIQSTWKVPFVDYPKNYRQHKEELDAAYFRCMSEGQLYLRQDTEDFERALAQYVGRKYAISLNSGTDAIFLALKAAGIKEGDEVITPSHSYIASIEGIRHCHANPVFIDVNEDLEMNVDEIEGLITPRTKAILTVVMAGHMSDMERIKEIADRHNLILIEDACQALGAKQNGKMGGSFGLAAAYSFYPAKILGGYGDNGALVTDDEMIYKKVLLARDHYELAAKMKTPWRIGYNSVMDNLQAAWLNVKLKYLDDAIGKRRVIASYYINELSDIPQLILPTTVEGYFDTFQDFIVRCSQRDELVQFLRNARIEILWREDDYYSLANHKRNGLGFEHISLPQTEKVVKTAFRLPIVPELELEQIQYVVKKIKEFYGK